MRGLLSLQASQRTIGHNGLCPVVPSVAHPYVKLGSLPSPQVGTRPLEEIQLSSH